MAVAMGAAGYIYPTLRHPHWREVSNRAPREVNVTLRVDQIFPGSPQARSLRGLGTIIAASPTETTLLTRQVYFSAFKKINQIPSRTGHYQVRGVIEALPPEPAPLSFDDYLANLGIRQKLSRAQIFDEVTPPGYVSKLSQLANESLVAILRHGLGEHPTVTALYVAMLLGGRAEMTADQEATFLRSGTYHVFSISGLHVGVIAGAIYNVFSLLRISRRTTVVLTLPILWGYVLVTGANYPALRAFLMIGFFLGSQVARQPMNGLASLTLAAMTTLLYEPLQLYSSGFQMSYSVVLALVVMGAPLAKRWANSWHPFSMLPKPNWTYWHHGIAWSGRMVLNASAGCWAAFLASIPAGIGYFQLLSPGSLIANLTIIPCASLVIIAGFLSLLSGLSGVLALSFLFNHAAAVVLIGMNAFLGAGTAIPGVYLAARFTSAWQAPVAIALLSSVFLLGHAGGWSRRFGGYWPPALVAGLIALGGWLSV